MGLGTKIEWLLFVTASYFSICWLANVAIVPLVCGDEYIRACERLEDFGHAVIFLGLVIVAMFGLPWLASSENSN